MPSRLDRPEHVQGLHFKTYFLIFSACICSILMFNTSLEREFSLDCCYSFSFTIRVIQQVGNHQITDGSHIGFCHLSNTGFVGIFCQIEGL